MFMQSVGGEERERDERHQMPQASTREDKEDRAAVNVLRRGELVIESRSFRNAAIYSGRIRTSDLLSLR